MDNFKKIVAENLKEIKKAKDSEDLIWSVVLFCLTGVMTGIIIL